jgi:multiple sugar transport system substrate-binding protein
MERKPRFGITRRALLALAVIPATIFVGAAPSLAAAKAPAGSTFGVNAKGTVQFWNRSATCGDGLCTILANLFNKTHPGLKVVVTQTCPNCDTDLLATAIRAGNPPDLVGLNDIDVPAFSQEGALMNLTKYVSALPYEKDLSPGHLALGVFKGQNYAVPYLGDLSVLWYNKNLFELAGLNPNDPPTTFAAMLSDAQKITALGAGNYGIDFPGDCQGGLGFVMEPNLWAVNDNLIEGPIGAQTINIAHNGPLAQLLTLYRNLWNQGLAPANAQTDNCSTWQNNFAAGKIGLLPGAYGFYPTWVQDKIIGHVGIAPLPGPNGGYSTFDGGDDFVIPAGAKNASGAWEFAQWVLQPQQQELYPSHGYTPVRTDILNAGYTKANPYDAVALQALAKGNAPVTTIYDQAFNEPNSPWFQMFTEAVYKGNITGALQTGQAGFEAVARSANDLAS